MLDLERKLRCRECDAKGKAVISVRWGERRIGLGPALREAVIEVCNGVDSSRLAAASLKAWVYPVTIGDSFRFLPGCDHTTASCQLPFKNLSRYRGFPYIPPPETAV